MRYRWELALVGVCAIWGSTFVIVQDAVERTPPFLYLGLRFAVAGLALSLFGAFRGLQRDEIVAGALIGVALFAGYAFQTVGLQYTSSSNAGFITGMFVVITPALAAIFLRKVPRPGTQLGVILATTGLILLAMPEGFRLQRGDALVLACAVSFSVHILLINRLASALSALRIAGVQIAVAAVLSTAWSVAAERESIPTDGLVWFAIVLTGVFATALAFLVQTRTQQHIGPTKTAVILTAEPVFAGIFGFVLAGDRLTARGYLGGMLIVTGILAAELLAPAKVDEA